MPSSSLEYLNRVREASHPARSWYLSVLGFHLLTRLLTLLAIAVGASRSGKNFPEALLRWDGRYYRQISEVGYPNPLPLNEAGQVVTNPSAFFPLFPYLVRAVMVTGLPFWLAGALLALVFSTAAAVLIALVVRRYTNDRVGLLTACLWSAFPTAGVLSVPYTEAIFTCLAAATLWFVLQQRWGWVAVVGALCAFSRPTGVVVVGALGVVALHRLLKNREWRPLLATTVSGLGVLAGLAVIGLSSGRWDAWFITESQGWRLSFDGGLSLAQWMYLNVIVSPTLFKVAFTLGVLGVIILAVVALLQRPPLVVAIYLGLGVVMAVGQGGQQYLAQLRYVLPLFPLVVPVAIWLQRAPRVIVWLALLGCGAVSATVGFYYFSVSDGAP